MTEKDILCRCEMEFLSPDDEHEHTPVCEECGEGEDLYNFGDEILCADCIALRFEQNSDDCVASFLEENYRQFREFIRDYFDRVPENQEV